MAKLEPPIIHEYVLPALGHFVVGRVHFPYIIDVITVLSESHCENPLKLIVVRLPCTEYIIWNTLKLLVLFMKNISN